MPGSFILIGTLIYFYYYYLFYCAAWACLTEHINPGKQPLITRRLAIIDLKASLSFEVEGKVNDAFPFLLLHTNISSDLWARDGDKPLSRTLFRYVVRDGVFPDDSLKGKNNESGVTAGLGSGVIFSLRWSESRRWAKQSHIYSPPHPRVWFYPKRLAFGLGAGKVQE